MLGPWARRVRAVRATFSHAEPFRNGRNMSRQRFEELMREAVTSLPQDVKSALRIVEDPEGGR